MREVTERTAEASVFEWFGSVGAAHPSFYPASASNGAWKTWDRRSPVRSVTGCIKGV